MQKIIYSTSLTLLLLTAITYADIKTDEQVEVKKNYLLKIELDKVNEVLSKDYEKYGIFHLKVAEDYKAISETYFSMGKYDESIEYALSALKVAMKLQKDNDPTLAKLYFDTGNKYYMHKQHPTAILYMKKAANIYENSPKKESLALANTYEGIASTYINLEDYKKSLLYNEKALSLRKKLLPQEDESLQRSIQNSIFIREKLKK